MRRKIKKMKTTGNQTLKCSRLTRISCARRMISSQGELMLLRDLEFYKSWKKTFKS